MIKRVQVGDKVYDINILDDIYIDLHMAGKKGGKVIRSDRLSLRTLLVLLDLARSNIIYEEDNEE